MSRNKIRSKIGALKGKLAKLKSNHYYHQPEDVKELKEEIRKLEMALQ